ncbi:hypothetical protein BKA62DRAFT_687630 [Auriculariales sp. MPI-PUGE-AT-0066]|nr:hypothetical protein BKA62DRAFT_687630 [Auriculariales sp. MPI-PUGE-AT-0066]
MATRLEPMNASQHHSKVKVTIELGARTFVAGQDITGRVSLETRADHGLGLSVIQIELIAVQELMSRDHSASSTFLHSRRLFQGPGLPPSNALPQGYWPARKGTTTFLFRFPVPLDAPSTINFGNGLAKVTYRLKATVGVTWKHEKKVVTDLRDAEVVECGLPQLAPEGTVAVGENGKIWMQGRLVGGIGIAGHPTCVELSVRNQTAKKASGLSLSLVRRLHLPAAAMPAGKGAPFQLSDTLITVPFKGPEYQISPGGEGVANLVFEIPRAARGVRGGQRQSAEGQLSAAEGASWDLTSGRLTDALFEVRCIVEIKLSLGIGSKDLLLDLPLNIMHPIAVPEVAAPQPQLPYPLEAPRAPYMGEQQYSGQSSPVFYSTPPPGTSPVPHAHQLPYPPQHPAMSPQPQWNPYFQAAPTAQYYYPPPPDVWGGHPQQRQMMMNMPPQQQPPRPSSADSYVMPPLPHAHAQSHAMVASPPPLPPSGLPQPASGSGRPPLLPVASGLPTQAALALAPAPAWVLSNEAPAPAAPAPSHPPIAGGAAAAIAAVAAAAAESEEGKGSRASRIAQNLHQSSRNRSASPTSRRFAHTRTQMQIAIPPPPSQQSLLVQPPVLSPRPILSPKRSLANMAVAVAVDSAEGGGGGGGRMVVGTLRSDNVTALEQMAEQQELKEADVAQDKTLPSPPVPTGKPAAAAAVPRVTDIFGVLSAPSSKQATIRIGAPTTTAATATATLKVPNRSSGFVKPAGGLDALERRLLADVGTTKVQARVAEAESESVLRGLAAGREGTQEEGEGEELTVEELLALTGGRERALDRRRRRGSTTVKAEPIPDTVVMSAVRPHGSEAVGAGVGVTASQERKRREQEDPQRKAAERVREEEAAGLRRAAKGRVANWLSDVGPEPVAVARQDTIREEATSRIGVGTRRLEVAPAELEALRSDGVGLGYGLGLGAPPPQQEGRVRKMSVSSTRSTGEIHKEVGTTLGAAAVDDGYRTRRVSLPPPTHSEDAVDVYKNIGADKKPRPTSLVPSRSFDTSQPTPNLGVARPTAAAAQAPMLGLPQVKNYDVRSARGGRGGKVTSVAALWAAASKGGGGGDADQTPAKLLQSPKPKTDASPFRNAPTAGPAPKLDLPLRTPPFAVSPTSPSPRNAPSIASKPAPPPVAAKPNPLIGDRRPPPIPASASQPGPSKPPASTKPTTARMIKSSSVPASLSPSLAKPTLSTTASLARPVVMSPAGLRSQTMLQPVSTVSDLVPAPAPKAVRAIAQLKEIQSAEAPAVKSAQEMQFGKARLKELIQKYQDGGRA